MTAHAPEEEEIRARIMEALSRIVDPAQGRDIVSLGMISGLQVTTRGEAVFLIEVDPKRGAALEPLRQEAEKTVAALQGISKVSAVLTAERTAGNQRRTFPSIRRIIAVASGKGGVGKSTVAANLAISLANIGQKTGLLDADIYGPSMPLMMGLRGQKPDGGKGDIQPLKAHGVSLMSIGFMIDQEAPLIWRGPMVQSAVMQLFTDVEWGPLDTLIVDLPPGTGDAQLTLAQKIPVTGAVIVSTPQDIALLDARKGLEMFRKVNVPVLGLIENMSTYICPSCGHEEHIFGHGGAKAEAAKLGVPFLGEIPLHAEIRRRGDAGIPVAAVKESPHARIFEDIARKISD